MAYDTPLWLQALVADPAVTYSATQDRALLDGLFSQAGVMAQGAWLVSQRGAGANFSVDITAGYGVVAGTSVTGQGKYVCRSTAVQNVTVAAAPASGTRTDLIVAKVTDPQSDGTSTYGWSFVAVTGPDNAGTVPTVPANSLVVAQLTIPTGLASVTSANITDKRSFAIELRTRPAALYARNTTLSLANTTLTSITSYNLGALYGPQGGIGYSGGIYTAPVSGLYVWSACVTWPGATSSYRYSIVPLVNGSEPANEYGRLDTPAVVGVGSVTVAAGAHIILNAGDTLQVALYQGSGGTLTGVAPQTFALSLAA